MMELDSLAIKYIWDARGKGNLVEQLCSVSSLRLA